MYLPIARRKLFSVLAGAVLARPFVVLGPRFGRVKMPRLGLILIIWTAITASAIAAQTDPDRWLIVKNLINNTCAVVATKSINKNLVIVTSFKAYVMGSKAMKDMVVTECGCEKGCNFELPK
jgi:hypothetical protein